MSKVLFTLFALALITTSSFAAETTAAAGEEVKQEMTTAAK